MSWLATWNQQRQYLTHYSVKLCVIRERNSFREVSRRKSRFFSAAWTVFVPAPLYLQNALPLFTHTAFIISLHLNLNVLLNISAQMQPEAIFVCVCVCVPMCLCMCTYISEMEQCRERTVVGVFCSLGLFSFSSPSRKIWAHREYCRWALTA